MSDARIRGIVHLIEGTKTYGQKGFRKRMVVLEQNNGRFTNYIPVEFTNDACDRVDELKLGDEAEIAYRLTGRKWQKDSGGEVKYFLSAEATSFKVLVTKGQSRDDDPTTEFGEPPLMDDDVPF